MHKFKQSSDLFSTLTKNFFFLPKLSQSNLNNVRQDYGVPCQCQRVPWKSAYSRKCSAKRSACEELGWERVLVPLSCGRGYVSPGGCRWVTLCGSLLCEKAAALPSDRNILQLILRWIRVGSTNIIRFSEQLLPLWFMSWLAARCQKTKQNSVSDGGAALMVTAAVMGGLAAGFWGLLLKNGLLNNRLCLKRTWNIWKTKWSIRAVTDGLDSDEWDGVCLYLACI